MRKLPRLTQLRAARLARGLTLDAVAKAANISRTRCSYVERDPSLAAEGETERILAAIERLDSAPVGSDRAKLAAMEITRKLGVMIADLAGSIDPEEIAAILNIPPDAIIELCQHAVMSAAKTRTKTLEV